MCGFVENGCFTFPIILGAIRSVKVKNGAHFSPMALLIISDWSATSFSILFFRKRTAIMFGCYQNFLERSVRSVVLEISSLWICFNEIKKVKPGIDLLEFLGLALLSIVCSSLFSLSAIVDEYSRFSGHVNSRLKRSLPIFFYFFFQKRCLPIEMGNIISPFTKMIEKGRYNVHGFPFVLWIST